MVGARIVPHRKDGVGVVVVFERHRRLARTDDLGQADAGRLVAHVGAVGEVVGAVGAHEELKQKGGFVRTAAGGVELGHIRVGQGVQVPGDRFERLVPADGAIGVAFAVIHQWVREAAQVLDVVVMPGQ